MNRILRLFCFEIIEKPHNYWLSEIGRIMQEFIAIDFETANPKRVSACALGYAKVRNCAIIETNGYLMKPVGGHAPFQSKIHGNCYGHTSR